MATRNIYVEGGGRGNPTLDTRCRRAFGCYLSSLGLDGRMPIIHPCGDRHSTWRRFDAAVRKAKPADVHILLVDSEESIPDVEWQQPWQVLGRTGMGKPKAATDQQAHLMVQCMETWLVTDTQALLAYFGPKFDVNKLPRHANLEAVPATTLSQALNVAARNTPKKGYDKGRDSFALLTQVNPTKVATRSPWAKRFHEALDEML